MGGRTERSPSWSFGGSGSGQVGEAYTNYRSFPSPKFQGVHSLSEAHPSHSLFQKEHGKRMKSSQQEEERRETIFLNSQYALFDHLSATVSEAFTPTHLPTLSP